MADAPTPMLFAPPQPPFQLPLDGTVVLGRSSESHMRLPDADTSRRHAEIVCGEGRFLLRDLGSTNGTFVNGVRVAEQILAPGDRIRIGANTVTFCQVSAALDGASDTEAKTLILERPATSEVFRGDLAEIPPFAVLQILEMGHKTGMLQIDSDTAPGRLWFASGEPVHAETKDRAGFDAALAIVNATAGRFVFEPQLDVPEKTIEASVTELLLEASRHLDEGLL